MAQTLQNVLYLLTPGLSLRRDGLALRVEHEKQLKLSLPVHNLESVFVFGVDIYVSPSAMRLCWEHGASVCYFTDWGRLEARVEGVPQGSMMLRRAQHAAASNPTRTATLARSFVAGKLHNVRWLLARSARDAATPEDGDLLRTAAESHAYLLRELGLTLPFDGRNRRPPRDAINALLSFLYALLRHDCVSALTAVGLDPFVGFLHTDRAGRESLALDLMEEFRPWVERLALTLLNRGELKAAQFVARDGGAVELADAARKTLVAAYQQRKLEEATHPLFQEKVRHGQLVFIQAKLLARALRSDVDYTPHLFA